MTTPETPASVQALLNGSKYEILSYSPYPTGYYDSDVLKEVSFRDETKMTPEDRAFCELIDNIHEATVQKIYDDPDARTDNKCAVEVRVDGFEESLFLVNYDSKKVITTDVRQRDSAARKLVPQD